MRSIAAIGTRKPLDVSTRVRTPTTVTPKGRCGMRLHCGKFVGRTECVEHGCEAGVKDAVQGEHCNSHGYNDIKDVIFANWSHPK